MFVASAGAGPIRRPVGKMLIRTALGLADFRSYRDQASLRCVQQIGCARNDDRVFPDLAFSLPVELLTTGSAGKRSRPVVGIGVMEHGGMYGNEEITGADYVRYVESLSSFASWLLHRGYDIRLLIGDVADAKTAATFRGIIGNRIDDRDMARVTTGQITSSDQLLAEIAGTEFMVATRFHNILLGLFFHKPTIAISFHHKCSGLMEEMGLSEYCLAIQAFNCENLISLFLKTEENADVFKETNKD